MANLITLKGTQREVLRQLKTDYLSELQASDLDREITLQITDGAGIESDSEAIITEADDSWWHSELKKMVDEE